MKRIILLSLTIAWASNNNSVIAQNTSNYRLINQSSNGLAQPSSSYIGPGTLSKTAQEGAGYVPQANPGLPKVNRGAYIGTPGDNLYSGNPDLSQPPQPTYSRQPIKAIYRQPVQTAPNVYLPDANIPMSYANYKTDVPDQKENNTNNIDNKILPGSSP